MRNRRPGVALGISCMCRESPVCADARGTSTPGAHLGSWLEADGDSESRAVRGMPVFTAASGRTRVIGLLAVLVAALFATIVTMSGQPNGDLLAYLGPPVVFSASAAVCALCGVRLPDRSLRRIWYLTAGGLGCWAGGDVIWAYYYLVIDREIPYPGVAEILYAAFYVLVLMALITALMRYRNGSDLLWPSVEAVLSAGALGLGVWVVVVRPLLSSSSEVSAGTVTDLAYIAADLGLLMVPALTLLLLSVGQFDRMGAIPWALYAGGVAMMALGDLGWFWQQSTTGWQPGSLVDFSWMAGAGLLAVAASAELDFELVRVQAQRPNEGLSLRAR